MYLGSHGKSLSRIWISLIGSILALVFGTNLLAQTPTLSGNNVFTGANTFPSINGIFYVDGTTYRTLADALAAAQTNGGGKIILPPGTFHVGAQNVITAPGIHIVGSGIGSTLLQIDAASGDVFIVQGGTGPNNLNMNFELGNMTITPAAGVVRSSGAVLVARGRLGYVHDLLLQDTYRGFVEQGGANCSGPTGYCANAWTYTNIYQTTNGGHSGAFFILGGADGTSVGDIMISNCESLGQGATYDESQMIVDTGVDTLKLTHYDMGYSQGITQSQPAILIESTVPNGTHPPRWIRISDSSMEAKGTSGIYIAAGYDIALTGDYWASSTDGIVVAGGTGVRITSNVLVNNAHQGVVIGGSSSDVLIADSDFSNNSQAADAQWYHINVFAGDFRITGNRFGNHLLGSSNRAAAAIVVNSPSLGNPTKDNFIISANRCDTATVVTCYQDSSGSTNKQVFGNLPPP
jgi:parallel beta-helix repeat protein